MTGPRPTAGRWIAERLDDLLWLALAVVAIPIALLLVGSPFVLLSWAAVVITGP
jgi:hypothetical protein